MSGHGLPIRRLYTLFGIKNRGPHGRYGEVPKKRSQMPLLVRRLIEDGLVTDQYEVTEKGQEIIDIAMKGRKRA